MANPEMSTGGFKGDLEAEMVSPEMSTGGSTSGVSRGREPTRHREGLEEEIKGNRKTEMASPEISTGSRVLVGGRR